jgi:hypothetical protein
MNLKGALGTMLTACCAVVGFAGVFPAESQPEYPFCGRPPNVKEFGWPNAPGDRER